MGLKVALVTTPSEQRSRVAEYTRQLWPYLREHCDLQAFVQEGVANREVAGTPARSVRELKARDFDRILYQIGNERSHVFADLSHVLIRLHLCGFDYRLVRWNEYVDIVYVNGAVTERSRHLGIYLGYDQVGVLRSTLYDVDGDSKAAHATTVWWGYLYQCDIQRQLA